MPNRTVPRSSTGLRNTQTLTTLLMNEHSRSRWSWESRERVPGGFRQLEDRYRSGNRGTRGIGDDPAAGYGFVRSWFEIYEGKYEVSSFQGYM